MTIIHSENPHSVRAAKRYVQYYYNPQADRQL
jgi:hypothetical protein